MWFLIALFVASLVLSLVLAPKPKITNATSGKLNDFQFPRADYGSPVPRIYGTVKFKAPNTIWSGDFKSVPIKKKVKTGLFSSKKQTTGYKYYVGFDLAVCLGPGFRYRRLWAGNYELWNGCLTECYNVVTINLPELFGGAEKNGGFTGDIALYCGAFDQARDSYSAAKVDPDVPAYVGIAHMVFRGCYVGNSTSIQPIYVEGSYFSDSLEITGGKSVMPNGLDINPVEVLYDLICNDWGNLDVDPSLINVEQWREVGVKVWNENNGFSAIISNASQGADVAKQVLTQIAGTLFEDPATGLFDLILLRDDYEIEDLPILGPDEIVKVSNFTKMLWSETYNRVRVKFTDRSNGFKEDSVAVAEDFANIRFQRSQRTNELTFETVYEPELANEIAARELSNINVPLYSFELEISRLGANLRPGSPFIFHWPEYGIELMVCRLRKFGLGTLQDGKLTASVVQDQFSVNATVIAPPTNHAPAPANTSPQIIANKVLFELPYWLDQNAGAAPAGQARYAVFASPPSNYSYGFTASIVGTFGDSVVVDNAAYSNSAKLVEALPKFAGFELGYIGELVITDLFEGSDEDGLVQGTFHLAKQGQGLFMLNGEILAYEGFTTHDDGTTSLSNVHRALLDTTYVGGALGDTLYFFDGQEGFFDETVPNDALSYAYLQDIAAGGTLDAATAPRLALEPVARRDMPLPADGLALDGTRAAGVTYTSGDAPALTWNARNRLIDPTTIEFEPEPAEADEAGATYYVEVTKTNGDVIDTIDPIVSGATITLTDDMAGAVVLKLWTKRDGLISFTPALYPLAVEPTEGTVTIDGDILEIDGETIEIDA